jgi:hypothetical protein
MKERFLDQPIKKVEKKTTNLSFLKEKGALKKWLIATEVLERKK